MEFAKNAHTEHISIMENAIKSVTTVKLGIILMENASLVTKDMKLRMQVAYYPNKDHQLIKDAKSGIGIIKNAYNAQTDGYSMKEFASQ